MVQSLVQTLIDRQQDAGESDRVFAARMGLSRTTWTRVRLGSRRPGERFISGVMRGFPDLTLDCLAYLRDGSRVPQNVTVRDLKPVTVGAA